MAGIVLSTALGATAADPTSMMIRIPPALAKQIAQQSLGKPTAKGESHVEFAVKKPIDATVKNISIKNLHEVARLYLGGIFGINFETPFALPILVHGVNIAGDFRIDDIKFSQPRDKHDRMLGVTVKIAIPNVVVTAREVWAHESGLLPHQDKAGSDCPSTSGIPALDAFVGNHVWARDVGPKVFKSKKHLNNPKATIYAIGRFGAEILEQPGAEGRLAVYPISIDIANLDQVLNDYYELDEGRLVLPKIQIKVGDTCYPSEPSEGIRALFQSLNDKLKREIVKGVAPSIKKEALKSARNALADVEIPADKGIEFRAAPISYIDNEIRPTYIDHTYVRRENYLLTQANRQFPLPVGAEESKKSMGPAPIAGVLHEIDARLSAENFSVGADGALQFGLSDHLRANGKNQASVDPYDVGSLPAQPKDALRIILNRSFFESKTELVEALQTEQKSLLPKELSLGDAGIVLHPSKSGKMSLVAHVVADLKRLTGIKRVFTYLERFAGNKKGTIEIPVQLDVEPSIVVVEGVRNLQIKLVVNTNILQNEFGEKSNLGKIFPKVTELLPIVTPIVNAKISEAAKKLNDHPILVDLTPIESKSPIRVENVFFTGAGSLVVDLSAPNLPAFVKAAKEKKRLRKEQEAKEKGR